MNGKTRHLSVLGVTLTALAALACQGSAGAASAASYAASGPTRTVTLVDPILDMKAYSLAIPSHWFFQGAVVQGTSASAGPFPVFRISSPDGLAGIKSLPRLDWAWSDNPKYAPKVKGDSLPYKRELTAEEVLKYMVGVLKVDLVRMEDNPARAAFQRSIAARDTATIQSKGDVARAWVHYKINSIDIDERLDVSVTCMTNDMPMLGRQHTCNAYVGRYWAPRGKFPTATFEAIGKSLVIDPQWNARWMAEIVGQLRAMAEKSGAAVRGALEANGRQRTAEVNAFNQAQAMRQQQHVDFMASLKRGTDQSMARTGAGMAERGRVAGDWCDQVLDQQKRLDPATGKITKDSSAYSYTWLDESGNRIQTNDINANPNGSVKGNWALQQNVR